MNKSHRNKIYFWVNVYIGSDCQNHCVLEDCYFLQNVIQQHCITFFSAPWLSVNWKASFVLSKSKLCIVFSLRKQYYHHKIRFCNRLGWTIFWSVCMCLYIPKHARPSTPSFWGRPLSTVWLSAKAGIQIINLYQARSLAQGYICFARFVHIAAFKKENTKTASHPLASDSTSHSRFSFLLLHDFQQVSSETE